jgi:hypothetical protein
MPRLVFTGRISTPWLFTTALPDLNPSLSPARLRIALEAVEVGQLKLSRCYALGRKLPL